MKKNDVPIFFIGGRERGCLWIQQMIKTAENLVGACIMKEDVHEIEQYTDKIIMLLKKHKIPYLITNSVKKEDYKNFILSKKPELIIIMGWRTIIPSEIIEFPKLGSLVLHESLLPKYRGFAPVNWVVINGEKKTGVSLFYASSGIDNGDIIAQKKVSIDFHETAFDIYKKTSKASIELLLKFLPKIKNGKATRVAQIESDATYTCARTPQDGLIHWNDSVKNIYNLIRGLSYPYPGAYTYFNGKKIIIWKSSLPIQKSYVGRIPGRIVSIKKDKGVEVLTGNGVLLIEEIQVEGEKIKKAHEVFKSIKSSLGT